MGVTPRLAVAALVVALGLIVAGVALIYVPAGLIVAGLLILAVLFVPDGVMS